jgi:NADH:ubiquinone oxidoreductase subunit K
MVSRKLMPILTPKPPHCDNVVVVVVVVVLVGEAAVLLAVQASFYRYMQCQEARHVRHCGQDQVVCDDEGGR